VSTRTIKKLLLSLIAIGILGFFTTGGVYAVFVTESGNPGSIVGSATFTMNNTVAAGTACASSAAAGNSNTGCDKIVTSTSIAQAHLPGALTTVAVAIQNAGSTPAYDLWVSMPGASAGAGCSSADNAFATIHGGGNACGATGDLFYIQENDGSGTPIRCWYPAGAGACAIGGGGTLNGFSTNYYFNGTSGGKLDLGTDGSTRHGLSVGSTRHFVIGIQENSDNTMQGETATFSLLWHLDSTS
jgi:hypothetical protein